MRIGDTKHRDEAANGFVVVIDKRIVGRECLGDQTRDTETRRFAGFIGIERIRSTDTQTTSFRELYGDSRRGANPLNTQQSVIPTSPFKSPYSLDDRYDATTDE